MTNNNPKAISPFATFVVVFCLWCFSSISVVQGQGQWTAPDGNGNISSTNTGSVGVGTAAPTSLQGGFLPLAGRVFQVRNMSGVAQVDISAAGAGNIAAFGFEVGDATATKRFFQQAYIGASNALKFRTLNEATGAMTQDNILVLKNTGDVGIGVASPTRRLEVFGGNVFHQFSATAGSEYGFYTASNNNHLASNVYFDGLWKMITPGKGAFISTAPLSGSAFSVYADNTSRAVNAIASPVPIFTVNMGGNVGIGTLTPDSLAKLHVYGSGMFGQDIQTTTNDWTRLRFMTPSRTWGFFLDGGTGGIGTGKFGLYDYTSAVWRLVADTTGNIGIGTTSPTTKLDVVGVINATQGFKVNGADFTASQWASGSSSINYTAGNVGIGTASPIYSLDVNGGLNAFRTKASTSSANDTVATFENSTGIQMIVRANGNVGIGVASPTVKLDVAGVVNATGLGTSSSQFDFTAPSSATFIWKFNGVEKMRLDGTGNITISGNINAKYQDVAEWVESSEQLSAGTVVVLDGERSNQVIASTESYDTRVAGVISARPGIALGEQGDSKVLVATTGRVKIRVSAKNGPIRIGDLLVTSDQPGVAMRSVAVNVGGVLLHRPGTLIGKALEPLSKGEGEILVLLSLQ